MGKYDFVQNREEFDMENLVNDLINLANQEYQKNGF